MSDDEGGAEQASQCPVVHTPRERSNRDWWPGRLDLRALERHAGARGPLGEGFDYAAALGTLDVEALRRDVVAVMTDSQAWWPADYGHYGPLFVRMSWHSAGTYRIHDGRGGASRGAQRFAPLNSWPDNANLDKARRLLWPVKQRYGSQVSWADLIVLAGNCALEAMGLATFGFAFGREDGFGPEEDVDWGHEDSWLGDDRYHGDRQLDEPYGAVQMGLIYVNPEGPNGTPDPLAAARDVWATFARMAMDDEETVALIAGGHTFGKTHGAVDPALYLGPEPEAAPIEEQGLGWRNTYGTGSGDDTYTSGLEGAWTANPTAWDGGYFDNLFGYEWELTASPAGAHQWRPTDRAADDTVPDAHDPGRRHAPMMLTTDLALKVDPQYRPIAERFHAHPDELAAAFAKAWYKLLHRDMGPVSRLYGPWVPAAQPWQDPVPPVDHELVDDADVAALKAELLASGLSVTDLVSVAWAAAASFRASDRRGGANGGRLRLAPQRDWEVNAPAELHRVLGVLEQVRGRFSTGRSDGRQVSLADLIVLAGSAGIEEAARRAGHEVQVPFVAGRTDATEEATDVASFAVLEPVADGFRNYVRSGVKVPAEHLLVDRADLLSLTAAEMTVLVGGLRVLGATYDRSARGVLTARPGTLTTDFFVNLLDQRTEWAASATGEGVYEGRDRASGELRFTGTAVDLVFGSNASLRAIAEVYAAADGEERFLRDFVAAWVKVMELDRFELRRR